MLNILLQHFLAALLLSSSLYSASSHDHDVNIKISTLQHEVESLRRQVHGIKVDHELLEEKLEAFEQEFLQWKSRDFASLIRRLESLQPLQSDVMGSEDASLSRIKSLEVELGRLKQETQMRDKELKTTLESLSKALGLDIADSPQRIYTVRPGDTLEKIASRMGSSVQLIKEANNLRSDKIIVGRKLKIPSR